MATHDRVQKIITSINPHVLTVIMSNEFLNLKFRRGNDARGSVDKAAFGAGDGLATG